MKTDVSVTLRYKDQINRDKRMPFSNQFQFQNIKHCGVHVHAYSATQGKLEYYPYDKYKSPHTETPTSNRGGVYSDLNFGQLKSEVFIWGGVLWSEL